MRKYNGDNIRQMLLASTLEFKRRRTQTRYDLLIVALAIGLMVYTAIR